MKRELTKDERWCVGFVMGVVLSLVLLVPALIWSTDRSNKYEKLVAEQNIIIERYQAQCEVMITMIDDLLDEVNNE